VDIREKIDTILKERFLVIDGAMGTQIQDIKVPSSAWLDEEGNSQEGCNELLNATAPQIIEQICNGGC